jgi:hypothetical protein
MGHPRSVRPASAARARGTPAGPGVQRAAGLRPPALRARRPVPILAAMATDKAARAKRWSHAVRQLEAMAGEIRVQLHLGGMELRERWEALEPRVRHASGTVTEVTDGALEALEELVDRTRALRHALRERAEQERAVGPRHH